jgi:hypothetical protein
MILLLMLSGGYDVPLKLWGALGAPWNEDES